MFALSARQRGHAETIRDVAITRKLGNLAAVYGIACSGAEASLTNWENGGTSTLVSRATGRQITAEERRVARLSLGLGDGVPPWGDNLDSMGLFAQRPGQGWGAPADLMRPEYAAGKFLDRLAAVPGWDTLPASDVIARVQGFYDPTIYGDWLATAAAAVRL